MFYRLLHNLKKPLSGQKQSLLLAAAAFLFLTSIICSMLYLRQEEEALSSRIAPTVLRFHVLANSDSSEDQALKLEVKQRLIETITEGISKNKNTGDAIPFSKKELADYITSNRELLEEEAESYMAEQGYDYCATIRLENCYFPTKIYGDVVFPCGYYDAVRVLLGDGKGKNWWCVLYPPLCFTDNASAVVPDESKSELQNLLAEDDFSNLMKNRRVVFGDGTARKSYTKKLAEPDSSGETTNANDSKVTVHVRFRFSELLKAKKSSQ